MQNAKLADRFRLLPSAFRARADQPALRRSEFKMQNNAKFKMQN
jgi:hypothetical protein